MTIRWSSWCWTGDAKAAATLSLGAAGSPAGRARLSEPRRSSERCLRRDELALVGLTDSGARARGSNSRFEWPSSEAPRQGSARPFHGGWMTTKLRVYEVARDLGMDNKSARGAAPVRGCDRVRNHMSAIGPEAVDRVKRHLEKQKSPSTRRRADSSHGRQAPCRWANAEGRTAVAAVRRRQPSPEAPVSEAPSHPRVAPSRRRRAEAERSPGCRRRAGSARAPPVVSPPSGRGAAAARAPCPSGPAAAG